MHVCRYGPLQRLEGILTQQVCLKCCFNIKIHLLSHSIERRQEMNSEFRKAFSWKSAAACRLKSGTTIECETFLYIHGQVQGNQEFKNIIRAQLFETRRK